jgi:hypothetical protein
MNVCFSLRFPSLGSVIEVLALNLFAADTRQQKSGGAMRTRIVLMSKWLRGQALAPSLRLTQTRGLDRKSAWSWVAVAALGLAPAAYAQISPGPLARAHQSLNGDANCINCHEVSTRSPSFRCLECHKEIATEIERNRGLHATFPRGGATGSACVKCHSDHNGIEFQMIHWDPTPRGFDHSKTGYVLDGKHVGVSCRACHTAQHISATERGLLQAKNLNQTWMGLSPSCNSCHADPHQGRFGSTCTQCHSTSDWKGARIERTNFDHSKTAFPLLGAHRTVLCQSCHTAGADGQPRWSGLKFANCSDCHTDPHKGEFKQGCDSCHTTVTWKKSSFVTKFDHSKTGFPLLGKHAEVDCKTCHGGEDFKQPLPHQVCADCHKPDPHDGQFAKRTDGGKCESCHTVNGWSPSTFTVADHAKTGYPIVFPHTKVTCAQCHIPAGKETKFKIKFSLCVDCHKDEHEGQFAAAPWQNRCEQCHKGADFKTTSYTLALHQKSSYPLTGSHTAVACNDCHKPQAGFHTAVYHFENLGCTTCHEDVHHGEFSERMSALSKAGKPMGCEACHTTKEWNDVAKFDHDQTRFPLLGSHRAVACADCHKPPNMELTLVHVHFASASTACNDCHENPHAGQFGSRANNCALCHNSNKWKPSLFDHEKTAFSLKGAHEDVPCGSCHTLKRPIGGILVLLYKPTPKACGDCHGTNIPQPKDGSSKASIQFR